MKVKYIANLPKCFQCNSDAIVEVRANGYTRIRCTGCGIKTPFEKQSDAIVDWFLLSARGVSHVNEIKRRTVSANQKA